MAITLYSTHCPRCYVLEEKLKEKNIDYNENDSVEEMLALGIDEVPILCVDDKFLEFKQAVEWINAQEAKHI